MALNIVFSSLAIGPITVPNRVVRTGHNTGYACPDITDTFINYHLERAKGGCGLSILEAACVHPSSRLNMANISDIVIDGYRKLMAAVRPHGMKVFQQLWHGGNLYFGYDGPPWAVSTIPGYFGVVGKPMSGTEVDELVAAFAAAARRCRDGGLDGIELHAGHGYLFHQFLSPHYNNRSDKWGGSIENRRRFLIETLRAVRAAIGPDLAIGIRLSASEATDGITDEDNRALLEFVQSQGLVDYVNMSKGDYHRIDTMIGAMHNPTGYELSSAARTLQAARVPRLVAGRFRTLEEVEQLLRDGDADLVSMVRAQIADPHLVRKTREGKMEEVRPCIACNQGCLGGSVRENFMACLVNPATGREAELSEDLLQNCDTPRKVLIIGGGPAGMEAARVAALQGHRVTLVEARKGLGGTAALGSQVPYAHTMGDFLNWQERELYRLGVEIRLNTYFEAAEIRAEAADIVIIATGAMPRSDGFQLNDPGRVLRGHDLPHVVSSVDLLSETTRPLGKTALVSDSVGHFEAVAAAEHLLAQGVAVTFLTHLPQFAPYVATTFRDQPTLERFYATGAFTLLSRHQLIAIEPGQCIVRPSESGGNQGYAVLADTVVLVQPNEPLRYLYDELRDESADIRLIGDALSPRDIQIAVREGHLAARDLHLMPN